ncbi:MAG: hypothetical protein ABIP34_03330, partial [Rhodoferax sp.]|uniref:hypothetical protein n=1 Tax=Rhodoferax sp. TaxID=50421 RepID=UPI00326662B9
PANPIRDSGLRRIQSEYTGAIFTFLALWIECLALRGGPYTFLVLAFLDAAARAESYTRATH